MARQKKLKPLAKYLERRDDRQKVGDNASVIAMFEELAAKGGNVRIKRVARTRTTASS